MNRITSVGILVVLVVAFLAGRYSVPGVDPQTLARADSLVATKKAYADERTRRLELSDSLVTLARQRDSASRHATAEADRLRLAGRAHRTEAQRLGRVLDSAETAADSVPILGMIVTRLGTALDSTEVAADTLTQEVGRLRRDKADLLAATELLTAQVRADSGRMEIQEAVIRSLRKAHSGCRVPVLKIKCPVIGPGYGATFAGGQVQHGVSVSVVYPLIGPK